MLREVTDAKIVGADGEETDIFQGDLNIRRDE
jgi:hypothetical protein